MQSQWEKVLVYTSCYFVIVLILAVLFSGLSFSFVKKQSYRSARFSATLARAFLLPYSLLTPNTSIFNTWNEGLKLAQKSNSFYQDYQYIQQVITDQKVLSPSEISQLETDLSHLKKFSVHSSNVLSHPKGLTKLIFTLNKNKHATMQQWNNAIQPILTITKALLPEYKTISQSPDTKRYIILFQNNMELRPSGGFMGSYAEVTFEKGQLQAFAVQDIYVPDGQLVGHVEPPQPIQHAFQQGFWKLRDANWHPDFAKSADNVEWFYEQATKTEVDGMIAINFSTIENIAKIIGPIYLPDYQQTIEPHQLYAFLQSEVETNFFPGSTKKKDLLSALSTQFMIKLQQLDAFQYVDIASQLSNELASKNIQFHFDNPAVQDQLARLQLTGNLQNTECGSDCFSDYFSLFEANLGVNKANCCVERSIEIFKNQVGLDLQTQITVKYFNPGPPPELATLAGDYKSFVRIYLPKNTDIQNVLINSVPYDQYIQTAKAENIFTAITPKDYSVSQVNDLTEIGLWIYVPVQETLALEMATINYNISAQHSQLSLQKQSGVLDTFNGFLVSYNSNQIFNEVLTKDIQFTIK